MIYEKIRRRGCSATPADRRGLHWEATPVGNVTTAGLAMASRACDSSTMRRSRFISICIALVQILALTLWSVSAAQARSRVMVVAGPAMSAQSTGTAGMDQPCSAVANDTKCPSGCCHHHDCDKLAGCLGVAGGALGIMPSASWAERTNVNEDAGRFSPPRQVLAGLSIAPPSRPPNG